MRKGSDLIGKTVITFDTGKRLGRVQDLIFDQEQNQLLALLIDEGGLFRSATVLPLESVQAIGTDVIVVPSRSAIASAEHFPRIRRILEYNNVLKGTILLTVDGRYLGRMVDLYFDDQTRAIEGYEVSGGLFADTYTGRSFVPAPKTIHIGDDVAFVSSEVADLMEEQVGGLKAALQTAGENLQTATQTTGDRLQSATDQAKLGFQEAGRNATVSLTNAIVSPEEQKAYVVGKPVQTEVKTADGLVVFPVGQTVTAEDADFAEQQGLLTALFQATGGDVRQQLGERFQTGSEQLSDRLQNLSSEARERFLLAQHSASTSLTNAVMSPEEQKAAVVGKVSQRIVTAPNGTVLVVAGQHITPEIARDAEDWGLLNELYRATGGRLTEAVSQRANALIAGRSVDQAIGHRVLQPVQTRDGVVIAAPGQIVTDRVIEQAKRYHREADLLEAIGLSPRDAIRTHTSSTLSRTSDRFNRSAQSFGDRMHEEVAELNNEARVFWQNLRSNASSIQQQSARKLEEQRIKNALGRPVTRVILNEFDNVILNVGELITHQAIEEAREAGILDVLLNSVYTHSPQFSKDEMRAPGTGEASLQQEMGQS
jgi:uncharacterized protein YrrD